MLPLVSPELHIPSQMGSTCVLPLVLLTLHDLQILVVNLQLALYTIRSLVSVLTRNRPWVTGEVQLGRGVSHCLLVEVVFVSFESVFGKPKVSDNLKSDR